MSSALTPLVLARAKGEPANMEALIKFFERLENGAERRGWLLYEALRCAPLDQAIELARKADAFILGTSEGGEQARRAADADERAIGDRSNHEPQSKERSKPKARLMLSGAQRGRLIERLAGGAKNVEIAAEFGLSLQQVQGVRIGSAREIAARRERTVNTPLTERTSITSVQEVIRYLRQQDDVVVLQRMDIIL